VQNASNNHAVRQWLTCAARLRWVRAVREGSPLTCSLLSQSVSRERERRLGEAARGEHSSMEALVRPSDLQAQGS